MPPDPNASTGALCRNCETPLRGEYCHRCGQHDHDLDIRFVDLAREWLGSAFGLDARLWRTLRLLAARPGELTRRYLDGERAAFVSPLRLYLAASLLLFLVLSWVGSTIVVDGKSTGSGGSVLMIKTNDAEADGPTGDRESAVDEVPAVDTPTDGSGAAIGRFFERARDQIESDRRSFEQTFQRQAGRVIILLVPAFALLLKLLFLGARRPYLHHLVFSLHVHALAFVVVAVFAAFGRIVGGEIGEPISSLANIGLLVYLVIALRRFFGESRLRTTLKALALILSHLIVLALVLFGAFVVTVLALG